MIQCVRGERFAHVFFKNFFSISSENGPHVAGMSQRLMDRHPAITWARATVSTQRGATPAALSAERWVVTYGSKELRAITSELRTVSVGRHKPLSSVAGLAVLSDSFPVFALGRRAILPGYGEAPCAT